jgi:hypothetical protein
MKNDKTTAENLEARFDAGEDVMDYFATEKAFRRNQVEKIMPAKPFFVRFWLKISEIKSVEAMVDGQKRTLELRYLRGGRELNACFPNSN